MVVRIRFKNKDMTIPLLLRKQRILYSLQPQCNDFQIIVGQSVQDSSLSRPCILVLTRSADREIDELSLELAALNIPIVRLDSDLCLGQEVCWDTSKNTIVTKQGIFTPTLCWFRYFTSDSIQESSENSIDKYVRTQWKALTVAFFESFRGRKINSVIRYVEIDRISQLLHAKDKGLLIPKTVVTTRLDLAVLALENPYKIVVKSLGDHYLELQPGKLSGLFPIEVETKYLQSENEPAPFIAQEYIAGFREIKIFVIGLKFFAFSINKNSIDGEWSDFASLKAEPIPMVEELVTPVLSLMHHWNLDIACFDFIEADSGFIFLEVNTMCDWLWIESITKCSLISVAIVDLLVGLFARSMGKPN
jgi:hypothetical protein